MSKATLSGTIHSLAKKLIEQRLWNGDKPLVTRPEWTISDGRSRKSIWSQLVAQGYITLSPVAEGSFTIEGEVTSKALDEYEKSAVHSHAILCGERPNDPAHITAHYTPDTHRKWSRYVQWDKLSTAEKVVVLANAHLYTFAAVSDMSGTWEPQRVEFRPGGGTHAMQTLGRMSFGTIVVSCADIETKYREAMHKTLVERHAPLCLTSYLIEKGVLSEGEEVPVRTGQPTLGSSPALPPSPAEWGAQCEGVIDQMTASIERMQKRLDVLRKLQAAALAAGGWDKFVSEYNAELDAAVARHLDSEAQPA